VHGHVRPGDTVLVLGPGPIGLLCAAMARLSGAGYLGVVGMPADAARLEVARRIGADSALAASGDDVAAWARTVGDGHGFDVVVDAAGVSATLQTALAVVRPGGTIAKVGWGPQPLGFSLDPLVLKAVTLQGSFSHNWPIWEKVISLLGSGRLDLGPILNRVAPLAEWRSVFDDMHAGRIVKGVLRP
jgi:alcohol dehydrogenase/L-iditol 2-dehydrogenase